MKSLGCAEGLLLLLLLYSRYRRKSLLSLKYEPFLEPAPSAGSNRLFDYPEVYHKLLLLRGKGGCWSPFPRGDMGSTSPFPGSRPFPGEGNWARSGGVCRGHLSTLGAGERGLINVDGFHLETLMIHIHSLRKFTTQNDLC